MTERSVLGALRRQIERLLSGADTNDASQDREHGIVLATATLMAEVARADRVLDTRELAAFKSAMQSQFSLSDDEVRAIVDEGLAESESAVSLQGFTRALHESLTSEEKSRVIGMLWSVAGADGEIDKHEDALIARIGELMYVPRSEVLRLKASAGH